MRLAHFEIVRSLGKGTFGEVLLTQTHSEEGFQRRYAVKRLLDTVAGDPELVERFAIEARICGYLNHPNIVQVYNFLDTPDGYLLVMEHLEGVELRRLIRLFRKARRRLPAALSLELTCQLCEGLHFAHTARSPEGRPLGLIHRDIKPSNLMITTGGQLKIMDFGVARADFARTRTGIRSVKGTLMYMAPEQAQGLTIDPSVDQYAAALILAELILGHPVYDAPTENALLFKVATGAVEPALAELATHFPALEPILRQALALNPTQRYPNMESLGKALRPLLAELPRPLEASELVLATLDGSLKPEEVGEPLPMGVRASAEETELAQLRALAGELERPLLALDPGDLEEDFSAPSLQPAAPSFLELPPRGPTRLDPAPQTSNPPEPLPRATDLSHAPAPQTSNPPEPLPRATDLSPDPGLLRGEPTVFDDNFRKATSPLSADAFSPPQASNPPEPLPRATDLSPDPGLLRGEPTVFDRDSGKATSPLSADAFSPPPASNPPEPLPRATDLSPDPGLLRGEPTVFDKDSRKATSPLSADAFSPPQAPPRRQTPGAPHLRATPASPDPAKGPSAGQAPLEAAPAPSLATGSVSQEHSLAPSRSPTYFSSARPQPRWGGLLTGLLLTLALGGVGLWLSRDLLFPPDPTGPSMLSPVPGDAGATTVAKTGSSILTPHTAGTGVVPAPSAAPLPSSLVAGSPSPAQPAPPGLSGQPHAAATVASSPASPTAPTADPAAGAPSGPSSLSTSGSGPATGLISTPPPQASAPASPVTPPAEPPSGPARATGDDLAQGTLHFRILPANSRVVYQSEDVRSVCWTGCKLPPGLQVLELQDPAGRTGRAELVIKAGAVHRCLYDFDKQPPLSCR